MARRPGAWPRQPCHEGRPSPWLKSGSSKNIREAAGLSRMARKGRGLVVPKVPPSGHRGRRRASGQPRGAEPPNGYRPATREAAWLHPQGANQNKHAGREGTKSVVDNHHGIAAEGFKPRFLAKSTMACMSAQATMGAAKRELIECGTRAGRPMLLVPPACWTMTRSRCCVRHARLDVSERTVRCPNRGFTTHGDPKAAAPVLATAEPIRAGVAYVSHLLPPLGMSSMRPESVTPRLHRGKPSTFDIGFPVGGRCTDPPD